MFYKMRTVIYVHGKGGTAAEAEHYKALFPESRVIGLDYQSKSPWEAKREFSDFYDLNTGNSDSVILIANSIGAFFSMHALSEKPISKALFTSPVVNMERLIADMMLWSNVTEAELARRREIPTAFGETLSWDYLRYVREHPIRWSVPTCILYGERDNLTSAETIVAFAEQTGASLTIMRDGEHWFHTAEQMEFLDNWVRKSIQEPCSSL